MSTYYHTCPRCGASLDPGERCDCTEKRELLLGYIRKAVKTVPPGSLPRFLRKACQLALDEPDTTPMDTLHKLCVLLKEYAEN